MGKRNISDRVQCTRWGEAADETTQLRLATAPSSLPDVPVSGDSTTFSLPVAEHRTDMPASSPVVGCQYAQSYRVAMCAHGSPPSPLEGEGVGIRGKGISRHRVASKQRAPPAPPWDSGRSPDPR